MNTKDETHLHRILEAVAEIESYTKDADFDDFITNSMMLFATIKQLEILGESVNKLSQEIKDSPDVEWDEIAAYKNVLKDENYGYNYETIWDAVNTRLPDLKERITEILFNGESQDDDM